MDEAGENFPSRNACKAAIYALLPRAALLSCNVPCLRDAAWPLQGSARRQADREVYLAMTRSVLDPWSAGVDKALTTRVHDGKATRITYRSVACA